MKLVRLASADEVAAAAADRLEALAAQRPDAVLALPTGATPIPLYDELARRAGAGAVALARMRGFGLDELILPPSDERSFRSYMRRHVWDRTGLRAGRCQMPNPVAPDLQAECRRYETAIAEAGGLDLALLGVGADGHVAYNLPGAPVERTHVVELPDAVAESLALPREARPLRAISTGLETIRGARALLLLATGAAKAAAVRRVAEGRPDPGWPATFLADHPRFELLLDPDAATEL